MGPGESSLSFAAVGRSLALSPEWERDSGGVTGMSHEVSHEIGCASVDFLFERKGRNRGEDLCVI